VGPPSHLDPDLRDLWHAACRLLQQNMGLTTLSKASDFCKVSEKSEVRWHNGGVQTVFVEAKLASHE
jgi:hypothetical protein